MTSTELSSLINTQRQSRPGRPKSDTKRADILSAGARHFMEDGYGRTSMDAIAATAGVSKQTVYSHFASKEDLFRACVMHKVQTYGLDLRGFDASQPLDAVLREAAARFLDLLADPDVVAVYGLLIAESQAFPQLCTTFWDSGPQAAINALSSILGQTEDPEYAPVEDPELAAQDFLCLLEGRFLMPLLMHAIDTIPEPEKRAHIDRCVTQFLRWHAN